MAEKAKGRGTSKAAEADPDSLSFEQAVARVESIIERIESGELGLEDAIGEYERGIALLSRCRRVLDQAEQRVEELTARMSREAGEGSKPTTEPQR